MATIVYLIRHEVHGEGNVIKNVLTGDGRLRAHLLGEVLRDEGIGFDVAYSSPEGRCLETLLCVMGGRGTILPIWTHSEFGDPFHGEYPFTPEEFANLQEKARGRGVSSEVQMLTDPDFSDRMRLRGNGGAETVRKLVDRLPDSRIAICSRGGARIEPMYCSLLGIDIARAPFFIQRGGITAIEFGHLGPINGRELTSIKEEVDRRWGILQRSRAD